MLGLCVTRGHLGHQVKIICFQIMPTKGKPHGDTEGKKETLFGALISSLPEASILLGLSSNISQEIPVFS